MFTVWDVAARRTRYDWQSVPPVSPSPAADEWEDTLREPGQEPSGATRRSGSTPSRQRADPYTRAKKRQEPSPRRSVRTASDLMSQPVVFLTPEDTVGDAWDLVCDKRFRHIPILAGLGDTERRRLVGIVSDRDLLRVAGTPNHRPVDAVGERSLRTLMKSPVFSAVPSTPLRDIAKVMFYEHIGAMPICTQGGELVGILTRSDVLRSLLVHGPLDLWI